VTGCLHSKCHRANVEEAGDLRLAPAGGRDHDLGQDFCGMGSSTDECPKLSADMTIGQIYINDIFHHPSQM
jgi:hypothetical protein